MRVKLLHAQPVYPSHSSLTQIGGGLLSSLALEGRESSRIARCDEGTPRNTPEGRRWSGFIRVGARRQCSQATALMCDSWLPRGKYNHAFGLYRVSRKSCER